MPAMVAACVDAAVPPDTISAMTAASDALAYARVQFSIMAVKNDGSERSKSSVDMI